MHPPAALKRALPACTAHTPTASSLGDCHLNSPAPASKDTALGTFHLLPLQPLPQADPLQRELVSQLGGRSTAQHRRQQLTKWHACLPAHTPPFQGCPPSPSCQSFSLQSLQLTSWGETGLEFRRLLLPGYIGKGFSGVPDSAKIYQHWCFRCFDPQMCCSLDAFSSQHKSLPGSVLTCVSILSPEH